MSKEDEGMMGETIDALWCEFRLCVKVWTTLSIDMWPS